MQFIVSGSLDQTLRVWNTNGEKVHEHDCGTYGGVTALSFIEKTPAGPVLLVGLEDGTVQVRDFPGFSLAFELNSRVSNQEHVFFVPLFSWPPTLRCLSHMCLCFFH